ncbi:MAG: M1 family metallopeptidase [Bacteroidetes bacterium]|nr:M1 family metallopeptidase [Bacteroidota bacterium]
MKYKLTKYCAIAAMVISFATCKTAKENTQTTVLKEASGEQSKKINKPSGNYRYTPTILSDLIHTRLEVSFDWTKKYLLGKAIITCKPHFYPSQQLVLDARGMTINEVSLIQGATRNKLSYFYMGDTLTIDLGKTYTRTDTISVFIDYISKPDELKKVGGSSAISSDKGLYFINADGKDKTKPRQIWTQGETQASSVWFPTIDRPNQKTTQEIYITIDTVFTTLSNGVLLSSKNNGNGTRTDYWKMNQPHTPYLFMMAISDFKVVKEQWRNKEVSYYVDAPYERYAKAIFGNTPEMLEFFSNQLGVEYPWDKYAQVVVHDYVSGAMENTTATLHGAFLHRDSRQLLDNSNEAVIAHELFHQWFGDLVTCESWSNTPLNESFATYGECLWDEYKYGRDEADYGGAADLRRYLSSSTDKQVDLIRFYYEQQEDMFDSHSYAKGGRILHMLRKVLGDEAFFEGLKEYLTANKFKAAEAHHLRLAMEKVSGRDLNWFFNQWFFNKGHMELDIQYTYVDSSQTQYVFVKQTQDLSTTPLYIMPVTVSIYADGKVTEQVVTLSKGTDTFSFAAPTKPNLVNFDSEKMLLCKKTDNHTPDEWAYMFYHAPLFLDRTEPLDKSGKNYKAGTAQAKMVLDAMNDKHYAIREKAIKLSTTMAKNEQAKPTAKAALIKLAQQDAKASVRETAIEILSEAFNDSTCEQVYHDALRDSSYAVIKAALNAYVKHFKERGLKAASYLEKQNNTNINSILAGVYANEGDPAKATFMFNTVKSSTQNMTTQLATYGRYLKKMDNTEMKKGVALLDESARNGSAFSKVVAYNNIKELRAQCKTNMDELQKQLDEKKQSGIGTYVTEERKRDEWQNLFDFLDRTLNDIKTNEADEKIRSRMN